MAKRGRKKLMNRAQARTQRAREQYMDRKDSRERKAAIRAQRARLVKELSLRRPGDPIIIVRDERTLDLAKNPSYLNTRRWAL